MTYLSEGILSKWRYKKIFKLVSNKKAILEIGCGPQAFFLRSLASQRNKKLIGIDPKLERNLSLPDNLTLIKEKIIDKINLANDSVDCVIMLAVLEHLDKPSQVLNEVYRILKPNGLLCLTTPTPLGKKIIEFLSFKLKLIDPAQVLEHKNYFNKNNLEKMAQKAGFTKTKHQYFQLGCNNFFVTYK